MILNEEYKASKYTPPKPIEYEVDDRGCWNVTSHWCDDQHYPRAWRGGKKTPLHRYSYTIHHGGIPHGMVVMHSCDNKRCINPNHLEVGTVADNNRDAMQKGRMAMLNQPLPDDIIRAIVNDPRSHAVVAREYGLHKQTVIKRRQQARRTGRNSQ